MKSITIPCTPVYSIITEEIEDIGLEVTDEIMSLCKQIEQELLKQTELLKEAAE
jgi:hypothetical protein